MITSSYPVKILDTQKEAEEYGLGGAWYEDIQGNGSFGSNTKAIINEYPKDIIAIWILMQGKYTTEEDAIVPLKWDSKRWTFSGTKENPSLQPSLHWISQWHGYLTNGHLKSC